MEYDFRTFEELMELLQAEDLSDVEMAECAAKIQDALEVTRACHQDAANLWA
jgi:hypothetical protein